MTRRQDRTFTEVALLEAAARRAHVDLILKAPAGGRSESHLASRFLGTREGPDLVLQVPWTGGRKVFVPARREMEMAFPVGQFLLQAATRVLGHCQYPLHATRRVDGLVVAWPERVIPRNQREDVRRQVDPAGHVVAWVWLAETLEAGHVEACQVGLLSNWSQTGFGIRFGRRPPYHPGAKTIIRLDDTSPAPGELRIYRARLKHVTRLSRSAWLAGFGEAAEVGPGQAVGVIEALANAADTDVSRPDVRPDRTA